jgi:hypothetical protein
VVQFPLRAFHQYLVEVRPEKHYCVPWFFERKLNFSLLYQNLIKIIFSKNSKKKPGLRKYKPTENGQRCWLSSTCRPWIPVDYRDLGSVALESGNLASTRTLTNFLANLSSCYQNWTYEGSFERVSVRIVLSLGLLAISACGLPSNPAKVPKFKYTAWWYFIDQEFYVDVEKIHWPQFWTPTLHGFNGHDLSYLSTDQQRQQPKYVLHTSVVHGISYLYIFLFISIKQVRLYFFTISLVF